MSSGVKVGFIGIGAMGWPMASRLVATGFDLTVYDKDIARAHRFVQEVGGHAAETPAAAASAELVITLLPNSAIVEAVLQGSDGVLSTLNPGSLVLEMSSGVPEKTLEFAAAVEARGSQLIDAPVSGGVQRAAIGTLAIMVGGDDDTVARAMPVLEAIGTSHMRTGKVGSAHAMKALNNLCSAAGLLISVEALLIGKKFGLEPDVMVDVLNASTGMNNSTQKKIKQFVLSRKFDAGFGLDLMVKDLSIALDIAGKTGTEVPFSALCRALWADAGEEIGPGRDHTEIARSAEGRASIEL